MSEYHIMPIGDLRDHEDSVNCWCEPTADDEQPSLYIHHSMDGREDFEEGRRLPS